MGIERSLDPSVEQRISALHKDIHSRKEAAAGRLIEHQSGLSDEKHKDLRNLLTKVQVALRESHSEGDSPAHGLDAITARINSTVQIG